MFVETIRVIVSVSGEAGGKVILLCRSTTGFFVTGRSSWNIEGVAGDRAGRRRIRRIATTPKIPTTAAPLTIPAIATVLEGAVCACPPPTFRIVIVGEIVALPV
jgi:hypothetical protein